MPEDRPRLITVHGLDGLHATATHVPPSGTVDLLLDDGQSVVVPADLLTPRADGAYTLPLRRADLSVRRHDDARGAAAEKIATVPVVHEEVKIRTEELEAGRVVVHVVPSVHKKVVDVPLVDEHVEVHRVPAARFVDRAEPPREVDGVTIVPVYEEVLVIQKRLRVKEEIHIRRKPTVRHERHEVTLRQEDAEVLRAEGSGQPRPQPRRAAAP